MNSNAKLFTFYGTIILIVSLFLVIVVNLFYKGNDIHTNSKIYYGAYLEKEKTFKDIFFKYSNSLRALQTNSIFNDFVITGKNKEKVLDLFLHTKRSFLDITQIRYLNTNGDELLRIDGSAISVFYGDAKSKIVLDSELQNKADTEYFKKFLKSKALEVSYSNISLNKEHGKVTIPKEPTLRMGIKVYGDSTTVKGILIYNISLRSFFQDMYNHYMLEFIISDSEGNYIFHHDKRYGLLGEEVNYSLKNEFPNDYKNILDLEEYHGNDFDSYSLNIMKNFSNLKLIIKEKE